MKLSVPTNHRGPLAAALATALGLVCQSLPAAVSSCADDGSVDTLRWAVSTANAGDTIDLTALTCSMITLTNGELFVGVSDLAIRGPGADRLTIDGNHAGRLFTHFGAGTLAFSDVSLADGKLVGPDIAEGGCVYSKGSVALTRAAVTGCQAVGKSLAFGGGVFAAGDLLLTSSTMTGNVARASIGNGPKQVSAIGGAFLSGYATQGLVMADSVISGNTAETAGGLSTGGGGSTYGARIKYSTFSNNTASSLGDLSDYGAGGALTLLLAQRSLFLFNTTIDNNHADKGGGLFLAKDVDVTILQSTLSGNRASAIGGGAVLSYSDVKVFGSTIAFNTGGVYGGGGIVLVNANATLQSSIVADNVPTDLDGAGTNSGANNIIKLVGPNTMAPPGTDTHDPRLLPLAFNGGTRRTHALMLSSPAIDAGTNPGNLAADERGGRYRRVVGLAPDIGAIEFDADTIYYDGFESH